VQLIRSVGMLQKWIKETRSRGYKYKAR